MFDKFVWGIALIILGALFILKDVYGLSIPIWRTVIALLIIFWGISLLVRPWGIKEKGKIIFNEGETKVSERIEKKYDVVFGKGVFDLRDINVSDKTDNAEFNIVFGEGVLKIKEDMPIKIKATAVFGGVKLPDGSTAAFGESVYKTKSFEENKPHLNIRANAVFGGIDIEEE